MREDFDSMLRIGKNGRKSRKDKNQIAYRNDTPIDEQPQRNPQYYRHESPLTAPIRRYLTRQVGRKWDEIWSEICEVNDIRARPKPYIFTYLADDWSWSAVERNPFIDEDGKVYTSNGKYEIGTSGREFYVHPETNILHKIDRQSRKKPKSPPREYVVLDDFHQYHKVKGVWYLVAFETLVTSSEQKDILITAEQNDPELMREMSRLSYTTGHGYTTGAQRRYGADICAVRKQQASKREIRWVEGRLEEERRRAERD